MRYPWSSREKLRLSARQLDESGSTDAERGS